MHTVADRIVFAVVELRRRFLIGATRTELRALRASKTHYLV